MVDLIIAWFTWCDSAYMLNSVHGVRMLQTEFFVSFGCEGIDDVLVLF